MLERQWSRLEGWWCNCRGLAAKPQYGTRDPLARRTYSEGPATKERWVTGACHVAAIGAGRSASVRDDIATVCRNGDVSRGYDELEHETDLQHSCLAEY